MVATDWKGSMAASVLEDGRYEPSPEPGPSAEATIRDLPTFIPASPFSLFRSASVSAERAARPDHLHLHRPGGTGRLATLGPVLRQYARSRCGDRHHRPIAGRA